ncbi:MAG: 16S rRNA (cytosine(1402)-N(4))-methyltransferase RsmH [Pontimonas sp.]
MMTTHPHIPVLLDRCIELLAPALGENALVVDATLGMGGHSEALLEKFESLRLLGIDRDEAALHYSEARLERFAQRTRLVHARYDELGTLLDTEFPGEAPQGILFDLGVSSLQLDEAERGFSYRFDAPLDMRMDAHEDVSAADLIATLSAFELQRMFERYGDEPLASRYAHAIVTRREIEPISRTGQLVEIIDRATPGGHPRKGHNAKRVFQALRIAVNRELEVLETALEVALDRLAVGGRIVVMSYHSGEDRLVKHAIEPRTVSSAPVDLPVIPESDLPTYRWVVKGPEKASDTEQQNNPRSQSVRLRAAEKVKGTQR